MGLETYQKMRDFKRTPEPRGGDLRKFEMEKGTKGERVVPVSRALKAKELKGDVNVRVGGGVVRLTSLERVYWPGEEITKGELIRYYDEVSKYILPYLEDRPLIMKRYPAGISGKSVVAPYSVRPKPGATVSAPLEWSEVERKKIATADFHIANMFPRIGARATCSSRF